MFMLRQRYVAHVPKDESHVVLRKGCNKCMDTSAHSYIHEEALYTCMCNMHAYIKFIRSSVHTCLQTYIHLSAGQWIKAIRCY
jgi:hypothetical protein